MTDYNQARRGVRGYDWQHGRDEKHNDSTKENDWHTERRRIVGRGEQR